MNAPPQLILASTSAYRRMLLERFGLPFHCVAPQVDEGHRSGEAPSERAARLALAKAAAVAVHHPAAAVIGSDQVAVCNGRVLDKPGTPQRAVEQLQWLAGATAEFHTAVAVQCRQHNVLDTFVHLTRVRFRALTHAEIGRYVAAEQPLDCAGSFRSEALGAVLCESMLSDDPTGLVGLPLIRLAASLRALGHALP